MMPDWRAVLDNARAMLTPGGRIGVVDFHAPDGRLGKWFWGAWFGHDGVHLSDAHIPALRDCFHQVSVARLRAPIPYLPWARAHYYRFVGEKQA
jgi:S-adenosylmethionine-diacylgycerolhomoserine-N-methlytransferase